MLVVLRSLCAYAALRSVCRIHSATSVAGAVLQARQSGCAGLCQPLDTDLQVPTPLQSPADISERFVAVSYVIIP